MRKIFILMACLLLILSCGGKENKDGSKSGGEKELTYLIWDKGQEAGMKAIIDEFEKENPGVKIKLQIVGWEEYWTKLETSATGGTLPDIFWMHSERFYDYASNGMLMEVDKNIDEGFKHFPQDLVKLYQFNGKQYAVPKDFDTIGVFYNKELFDKAGVPYPDGNWDWAQYLETAKKLTKDGIYGLSAPLNFQEGFWNEVYQNEGYIIKDDKSGYNNPATQEAIQWWVDLSLKEKVSPLQKEFDEVEYVQMFTSGKVAMAQLGSWNLPRIEEDKEFAKKVGVTYLPRGKKQATIYNGLGYSVSAKTKYPEEAKKFLQFLATEKANLLQAKYVSAIPAYEGTQQAWVDHNKDMDLKIFIDQLKYGVVYPSASNGGKWRDLGNQIFAPVFAGKVDVKTATEEYAKKMNEMIEAK
ncbi:ABC transporter substrate-binding protein [Pseudoleptotrichia goodfellowii]|nr:sugar ABC transporter substrate-binding protein [Pseudoleptotrichia goodfellowii]BBM36148.1 family 1 extracellular solute-binding protein [Pseudoleptotrichia goodfellowii]